MLVQKTTLLKCCIFLLMAVFLPGVVVNPVWAADIRFQKVADLSMYEAVFTWYWRSWDEVLAFDGNTFIRLDFNGKKVWTYTVNSPARLQKLIAKDGYGNYYLCTTANEVFIINQKGGLVRRVVASLKDDIVDIDVDSDGQYIYFLLSNGRCYGMRSEGGYTFESEQGNLDDIFCFDSFVIAKDYDQKKIYGLSARYVDAIWDLDYEEGSSYYIDGFLYVLDMVTSRLTVLNPVSGRLISQWDIPQTKISIFDWDADFDLALVSSVLPNTLYVYDFQTGRQKWTKRFDVGRIVDVEISDHKTRQIYVLTYAGKEWANDGYQLHLFSHDGKQLAAWNIVWPSEQVRGYLAIYKDASWRFVYKDKEKGTRALYVAPLPEKSISPLKPAPVDLEVTGCSVQEGAVISPATKTITVAFNTDLRKGKYFSKIYLEYSDSKGKKLTKKLSAKINDNTLIINLKLQKGTKYLLTVPQKALTDATGQGSLTKDFVLNFSTE